VNVTPAFSLNVLIGTVMFGVCFPSLFCLLFPLTNLQQKKKTNTATYETAHETLNADYGQHSMFQLSSHAFASGALAGVSQAIFAGPLDCVNTQMWQKRRLNERLTISGELKDLLKSRGVRGLYQHLPLTLARDCLGLGLFFMTFETARKLTVSEHPHIQIQNSLAVIFSGALAGLAHQMVYYPIDLLKRMLILELGPKNQPNPPITQMWTLFKELIVRKRGLRFLLSGYANSLTRVSVFFSSLF